MSQLKLTADSGGGTVAIKAPASTTGNGNFELTLPGTGNRGFGKILQVVQTVKTDTFSTTSTSFADVTGLSASITPSSTSSKVLFQYTTNYSHKQSYAHFQLVRGSTSLLIGDADSSRGRSTFGAWLPNNSDVEYEGNVFSGSYLDSPSTTSATTYKIQMRVSQNTGYLNRLQGDGDAAYTPRMASSIILMEVAA